MGRFHIVLMMLALLICQLSAIRLAHNEVTKCTSRSQRCPLLLRYVCATLSDGTKQTEFSPCTACSKPEVVEY